MPAFILRRLAQMPVILAAIFLVTFALAWLIPGSPLDEPEGRRPHPAVIEAMERQYHLDSPWSFATSYLQGVFIGIDDHSPPYFGPSLRQKDRSVNDILIQHLPYSAALGFVALVIALAIGVGAGIIGALRPGTVLDLGTLAIALVGISLPAFVTGTILLILAALCFNWTPIGGWEWPGFAVWTPDFYRDSATMIRAMLIPALTLGVAPAAYIARLIRMGMADVLSSDFIRTARAKGVDEAGIIYKHALKVAFLPVLSFLGPAAAATMTGSFVVEQIFEIHGIGREFVNAVLTKDQFVILGIVLVYSTMLIIFNLAVDVAYAWVDPRIDVTRE